MLAHVVFTQASYLRSSMGPQKNPFGPNHGDSEVVSHLGCNTLTMLTPSNGGLVSGQPRNLLG